jgi:hypothetical protein
MPVDARSAPKAVVPSMFARLLGVLVSPRPTFVSILQTPRWVSVLMLVTVVMVSVTALFLATPVGRQALLDERVDLLEGFGQSVSDAEYEALRAQVPALALQRVGAMAIGLPLGAVAVAAVVSWLFRSASGAEPRAPGSGPGGAPTEETSTRFRRTLAVVAHSGAVLMLRQLVVIPMNYQRESLSNGTNVSVLFSALDEGSPFAYWLGTIDFFVVWWAIVLAIGLGVLYHRNTGPIAAGLFAVYGAIAVVIAGLKVTLGTP